MKLLQHSHVKYGLLMSLITSVCLMLIEVTGQNDTFEKKSIFEIFFTFIAPAIVWFFGIRARKIWQGNKLTFKQGLAEGFKISLVYGIISPFIFLKYYLLINPGILEYIRGAYGLVGASDAMVISVDMVVQFFAAIIFGSIYAAIISLVLRSKP
jgi:hypothetical protein